MNDEGGLNIKHQQSIELVRTPFLKTDYIGILVDGNLENMKDDVKKARNGLPYIFCQMKKQIGVEEVAKFLFASGGL